MTTHEEDTYGQGFKRKASGMKPKEHVWVMIAIILLAVGTLISITLVMRNQDAIKEDIQQHEKLDSASCNRALKNREILAQAIEALVADPGGRTPATQAQLQKLDNELKGLIASVDHCNED